MTEKKQGMIKLFEIDYSKMPDNTCTIKTVSESNQKVAVCKEQGKIKIFPVEGEWLLSFIRAYLKSIFRFEFVRKHTIETIDPTILKDRECKEIREWVWRGMKTRVKVMVCNEGGKLVFYRIPKD